MITVEEFESRFHRRPLAHHITSINNLTSIFADLELKSHRSMIGKIYDRLDNEQVQSRRSLIIVGERLLQSYVPLYLTYKTPMAAFNSSRNSDWVYLTFDLIEMNKNITGMYITDGNASSYGTRFQKLDQISDFDIVNWAALKDTRWMEPGKPLDLKRQRAAEVLIPDRLSMDYLVMISAVNDTSRDIVRTIVNRHTIMVKPETRRGWFFV